MMEGLRLKIPQRMMLVRICIIVSLIVTMLVSFNLWAGERYFPYLPAFDHTLREVLFSGLVFTFIILCLLASLFLRIQRILIFVALLGIAALIAVDMNRLQWWVYVYSAMLFIFVIYDGRVDEPNKYTSFFIVLQIMFASVYFFAGWQQLNVNFVRSDYADIIWPINYVVSDRQYGFFVNLGVFVPFMLMFIGISMIISAMRYLAITLAAIMHIFLLILLPLADRPTEWVLWCTNVTFLVVLFLLFSGKTKQRYFSPSFLFQRPVFFLTLVFFVVMPFFNRSGKWPDPISFNIKSGNGLQGKIQMEQEVLQSLPLYIVTFCDRTDEKVELFYNRWCTDELGVECYPGEKTLNTVVERLTDISHAKKGQITFRPLPKHPMLLKR